MQLMIVIVMYTMKAKTEKDFQASAEFEPMTSAITVQCHIQLSYEATTGNAGHFKWVC